MVSSLRQNWPLFSLYLFYSDGQEADVKPNTAVGVLSLNRLTFFRLVIKNITESATSLPGHPL